MYSCLIAGGEGVGAGLYPGRGGGKGLNTLEQEGWGWELGGGKGNLTRPPSAQGRRKVNFQGGGACSANLGGWGGLGPQEKKFKYGP